MEFHIIGIIASLLTSFGFVPQIIKIYKTRSTKDISTMTLFQFSIGVILWILYGIHIRDYIIITANIVTLVTLVIAIILYYRYRDIKNIK